MRFSRGLVVGLIGILAAAPPALAETQPSPPADPAAAWNEWVKGSAASYATRPEAVLKVDDTVYLKPGERAVLEVRQPAIGGKPAAYGFKLSPEANGPFAASYDQAGKASVVQGKAASKDVEGTATFDVEPGVRVRTEKVETAPGTIGLRVAVYNDANPDAKAFKGLDFYPYNASRRIEATFAPAESPTSETFKTSRGWYKQFTRVGEAVFPLEGQEVRLPVYAGNTLPLKPEQVKALSAFFTDPTSGEETYGVGRYISIKVESFPPQTLTIDFNYAHNPLCARSPHFNCPVATVKLPVALKAGEKAPAEP